LRIEIKLPPPELRTTTVYVTHDHDRAMTMADRIASCMRELSSRSALGRPLRSARNAFVAEFIGSPAIKWFQAAFGGATTGHGWSRAGPAAAGIAPSNAIDGQPVLYGVRPENLTVKGGGTFRSRVDIVELVAPACRFARVGDRRCASSSTARARWRQVTRSGSGSSRNRFIFSIRRRGSGCEIRTRRREIRPAGASNKTGKKNPA
jgi:ABC-type sugar transport system ATPase subunit